MRSAIKDTDFIAQPNLEIAPQPLAYASGRGAASAKVPNVLQQGESAAAAVRGEGVVPGGQVVAGIEPSLVSDMAVPLGQLSEQPGVDRVSANSLNNAVMSESGIQGDGALAEYAYADPSLLS